MCTSCKVQINGKGGQFSVAEGGQFYIAANTGFKLQIEVAQAASEAYHAIADTPIRELRTEEGARQIGVLVTNARDMYRRWQSYGDYNFPKNYTYVNDRMRVVRTGGVDYGDGLQYRIGQQGKPVNILTAIVTLGGEGTGLQAIEGGILSSRGRVIFGGNFGDERNWTLYPPFDDILKGDRIEDIPSLIGRIKR